jgi:DNA mismatch repair ATPase MutS
MSHQSSVARSQGEGTDHLSQAREEDQASQQSESSHQHHEYSQQPEPHHATPSQRHYQTLRTQQIQFDDYSAPGEPAPMDQSLRCLVVVEDGRKLALSFFDEEKNEILVEETTNSGLEAIERVMEHFLTLSCPNLVLVSKKIVANESLLEIITRGGPTTTATATATDPAAESTTAEMPAAIPYRQIKSADMEVNACRSLILQKLQVLSLARQQRTSPNYDPRRQFQTQGQYRTFQPSNYHSLASLVDFDCKAQVQSLGALLSFLQNTIFRLHDSGLITINDIKPAASTLYMHLSPATYSALHIFATEHHPNLAKGNGHSKEGFSLFSLLDRTQNKGGRQQLREWMLQPLLDIEAITERQDIVELFTRPELEAIAGSLLQLLKQVGAVDAILSRLQKVAANPQDFCTLSKTFSAAIAIASILDSEILGGIERGVFGINELNMKPITLLESILNRCHVEVLHELLVRITSTVDEEATKEYKHGVVIRRGFHEQLDAWKDQYDHLEGA